MSNLTKHTGNNVGGINPLTYVFNEDILSFTINPATLVCTIVLKIGKTWNYLYGTTDSIQAESKEEDTPAGMKYSYQIKLMIPKDRAAIELSLLFLNYRHLVIAAMDKNGITRVYGDLIHPMKKNSKLLKPPTIEGYNGWEVVFSGEFSKPACYNSPSNTGVPFPPPEV